MYSNISPVYPVLLYTADETALSNPQVSYLLNVDISVLLMVYVSSAEFAVKL